MYLRKILKSTAAIVVQPSVRILPTLLRGVAAAKPDAPKPTLVSQ